MVLAVGPLLLVPLFIRHLEADEYGLWITILTVTSYLGLLNLGIAQLVTGVVTREHSCGAVAGALPMLTTALVLYVVLSIAAWLVATAVLLHLGRDAAEGRVEMLLALWITITGFVLALPTHLFLAALRGCKRVADEQVFNAVTACLRYLATALALLAGFKLAGIAVVHAGIGLLPGWLAFWRLRRTEPGLRPARNKIRRDLVGGIVRPSAWYFVLQISGLLVWGIDAIVIAWFLGPASVPAYMVPLQLILALQAAASIVTNASTPQLAGWVMTQRRDAARRLYLDILAISLIVAAVACVGIWIGGLRMLEIWAGAVVMPDALTLAAMGVLLAIQCSLAPADGVLVGAMRHRGYAVVTIVEGIMNLVLSIWWVTLIGALGVILATLVARITTSFWYMQLRTLRILELPTGEVLREIGLSFALPATAGTAIAWAFLRPGFDALAAAAAGCLVAAATAAVLRRHALRRVFAPAPRTQPSEAGP